MKNRKTRTAWSIRVTHGGTAWLNERAAQLGISAAEYSRRLLFLEAWDGVVFDDCREIEGKVKPGMPIEAYLPYAKNVIERLRDGEAEVDQLETFVRESVLPALQQAKAKIAAARQMKEAEARQMRSIDEMVTQLDKAVERGKPS
jgi:hypothetical protein